MNEADNKYSVDVDLSNPLLFNEIYIPILHTDKRYIIMYGGRDSAKSYMGAQKVLIDTLNKPYSRYILLRKIYGSIKDSQYQTIIDLIDDYGLRDLFHITKNPLEITCNMNGNKILARGLDKPNKTKSIKDPTGIWYEEANEIELNDFVKSTQSLRTSKDIKIQEILTFNPEDENSWIPQLFFPPKESYEQASGRFNYVPSKRDDAIILHTTYHDNRFCSADRSKIHEMMKDIDYDIYKTDTLGLWGGTPKGLIHPQFEIYSEDKEPHSGIIVYGIDFGWHTTAVIKNTIVDNDLFSEEIVYESNLTNEDLINLLKERVKDPYAFIYPDAAEPDRIEEIYRAGFHNVKPAEKNVNDGIDLIKRFVLHIKDNSFNLIKEHRKYKWATDKYGNPIEKPIKAYDHGMDARRYAVYSYWKEYLSEKGDITGNPFGFSLDYATDSIRYKLGRIF